MKYRVLNFGFPATHEGITTPGQLIDPSSISDYDALILDPLPGILTAGAQAFGATVVQRRQREIHDLLLKKSGIVICVLRPSLPINVQGMGLLHTYSLLDQASHRTAELVHARVRQGQGLQFKVISQARALVSRYFRVLGPNLRFDAFLDATEPELGQSGGTLVAVDSVGYPVSVEFMVEGGRLCFVPPPFNVPGERVGAAVMRVVEAHFGGPGEIELPAWAKDISVPGADSNDGRIAELEKRREDLEAEISRLREKRSELLDYRRLLFGYGKTVLEPAVRTALRELGFNVSEPQEYAGEWDVELKDPMSGDSAIGEMEGSEGPIDVDKYRQLLGYVNEEVLQGRKHKGILIGNGYRSKELNAPERLSQFTEHALRGGTYNGFCLLPTTELFKAVCAVLESPGDEPLKVDIRRSILSAVGVWTFAGKTVDEIGATEVATD